MVGSWSKRTALLSVLTMLFFLWPPAAEETDVFAASAPTLLSTAGMSQGQAANDAGVSAASATGGAGAAFGPEAPGTPAEAASGTSTGTTGAASGSAEKATGQRATSPQTAPQFAPQTDSRNAPLPVSPAVEEGAEGTAPAQEAPPNTPRIDPSEAFKRLAAGDRTGGAGPDDARYVRPERPTVYLTFDDGPTKWTPQVLDILKEYQVPATFFVLGQLAEQQEDIVRRIVNEGHALGNHTFNHKYDELYSSFANFWEQVERTDAILRDITGQDVRLLRAPGGTATNFDAFYFYYLEQAGYRVHDWTVDSGDSKRRNVPAEEIVRNVKRSKLTHEVNVLLHDGAGHEQSVKALPEIIEYYQSKGYRFAALDERVKPASFQVGKVKWARSNDEASFLSMLTAIEAERHEPRFIAEERSRAVAVLSAKEGETSEREEWVALRDWADGKGAVSWDAAAETASVELGGALLRFNVRTGEAYRLDADGRASTLDLAFKMEGDRIRVIASAADAAANAAVDPAARVAGEPGTKASAAQAKHG